MRTNAWTALKADGNLGFLAESESLTSEHDVSMLLCVMRMYGCRTDEKRGRLKVPDFLEIVSTTDREKNFYGNAVLD